MSYDEYEGLLDGELPRPRSRNEALLMRLIGQGGGGGSGGAEDWAGDGDVDGLFDGTAPELPDEGDDGYADDSDIDILFND